MLTDQAISGLKKYKKKFSNLISEMRMSKIIDLHAVEILN